jgi:hypothetical protein
MACPHDGFHTIRKAYDRTFGLAVVSGSPGPTNASFVAALRLPLVDRRHLRSAHTRDGDLLVRDSALPVQVGLGLQ